MPSCFGSCKSEVDFLIIFRTSLFPVPIRVKNKSVLHTCELWFRTYDFGDFFKQNEIMHFTEPITEDYSW